MARATRVTADAHSVPESRIPLTPTLSRKPSEALYEIAQGFDQVQARWLQSVRPIEPAASIA
jgi:hypothetical protein